MGLKKLFKTGHVYAGPESIEKGNRDYEMGDVYAGPEQMEERVLRKPERVENNTPIMAVYAGPDVMDITRVPDDKCVFPNSMQGYPFNNIPTGNVSTGMACGEANVSSNGDGAERITCPECGEKTRHGRFCECCGAVLK